MNVISPSFLPFFSINLFPSPPPQLLSHPISKFQARALKAVAEVTGGNIHHHFTLLLPALIKAIVKAEEGGGGGGEGEEGEGGGEGGEGKGEEEAVGGGPASADELKEAAAGVVLSVEDVGVQWLLTELLNSHVKKDEGKASDAKWRATGLWLVRSHYVIGYIHHGYCLKGVPFINKHPQTHPRVCVCCVCVFV